MKKSRRWSVLLVLLVLLVALMSIPFAGSGAAAPAGADTTAVAAGDGRLDSGVRYRLADDSAPVAPAAVLPPPATGLDAVRLVSSLWLMGLMALATMLIPYQRRRPPTPRQKIHVTL